LQAALQGGLQDDSRAKKTGTKRHLTAACQNGDSPLLWQKRSFTAE
jgi:hypothetical protein